MKWTDAELEALKEPSDEEMEEMIRRRDEQAKTLCEESK